MKPTAILLLSFLLLTTGACHKCNDCKPRTECDQITIVDAGLYETAPDDAFFFEEIVLRENCLEITFTSSGCDGSRWVTNLIDSEAILESFPVQRVLRLSLQNDEECDAVITRTLSFDLTPIQLAAYDRIMLNIDGYEGERILYTY